MNSPTESLIRGRAIAIGANSEMENSIAASLAKLSAGIAQKSRSFTDQAPMMSQNDSANCLSVFTNWLSVFTDRQKYEANCLSASYFCQLDEVNCQNASSNWQNDRAIGQFVPPISQFVPLVSQLVPEFTEKAWVV
jgi:hypothetical protein